MRLPEYRRKTLDTLDFVARKVDEELIKEYEPKRWSLQHTGASGTPDEHPNSDVDINFSVDKETLEKYEVDVIGPYCAKLQLEAKRRMGGRDVTIWLQEIEAFSNAKNYRLYGRNCAMYGESEEERHIDPSDLPSPITNKLVLTQWALKERDYSDVTFLRGNENILKKVRRDPTLNEPVPWEGYEMVVRGMRDLVTGLSKLDSIKVSKSILRMAHGLHVSLGRPFLHNYGDIVDACHGMLAKYANYEKLIEDAKRKRKLAKEDPDLAIYDFNDDNFKNTLLDFAKLCRSETKEAAHRQGYFRVPERMACLNFYVSSSMAPLARSMISGEGASVAQEFSELLAEEVVELLLRYQRMISDNEEMYAAYDGEAQVTTPSEWVERLSKIGVPSKLDASEIEEIQKWLGKMNVAEPSLQGKIYLVLDEREKSARKLDEAISASLDGKSSFSYRIPREYEIKGLYVCRGDAAKHEEAVRFYKKALEEDVSDPYCWQKIGSIKNLPSFKCMAREIDKAMQTGNPWDAYNRQVLNPDILDKESEEIWEKAHEKRLERFETYVERMEKLAKEQEEKPKDCLVGHNLYEKFLHDAQKKRNRILRNRADTGRKTLDFVKEAGNPFFGIMLDHFEKYDMESRRIAEKVEMERRKLLKKVLSGELD